MTHTERILWETLVELDEAAKSMQSTSPKPDLPPLFKRLDELTSRLPKDTAPDLLHYLHRKSYGKARLWLEGREAENARGKCRH